MEKKRDTPPVEAVIYELRNGEKIRKGDYWYHRFCERWYCYEDTPRNLFGFRIRKTPTHSRIVRVVGLRNLPEPNTL